MDLYLQIVIIALIPFLLLGAYYAYRFFQIKKKLALRGHVTIPDDVISDLVFKVS